jgi:hypothetical protein
MQQKPMIIGWFLWNNAFKGDRRRCFKVTDVTISSISAIVPGRKSSFFLKWVLK